MVTIKNIKDSKRVKYNLSRMIEEIREERGLVGKEFYSGEGEGQEIPEHEDEA